MERASLLVDLALGVTGRFWINFSYELSRLGVFNVIFCDVKSLELVTFFVTL